MATNLVTEIAEVLSPSIVSRIASALGLESFSHPEGGRCSRAGASRCSHFVCFQAARRYKTDRGRAEAGARSVSESG